MEQSKVELMGDSTSDTLNGIIELSELQLVLIGGGIGETAVAPSK